MDLGLSMVRRDNGINLGDVDTEAPDDTSNILNVKYKQIPATAEFLVANIATEKTMPSNA